MPPRVSLLVPGIPPGVDAAFEAALAKDPARRMKDIELWSASFVELLENVPGDATGWPTSPTLSTDILELSGRAATFRLPG